MPLISVRSLRLPVSMLLVAVTAAACQSVPSRPASPPAEVAAEADGPAASSPAPTAKPAATKPAATRGSPAKPVTPPGATAASARAASKTSNKKPVPLTGKPTAAPRSTAPVVTIATQRQPAAAAAVPPSSDAPPSIDTLPWLKNRSEPGATADTTAPSGEKLEISVEATQDGPSTVTSAAASTAKPAVPTTSATAPKPIPRPAAPAPQKPPASLAPRPQADSDNAGSAALTEAERNTLAAMPLPKLPALPSREAAAATAAAAAAATTATPPPASAPPVSVADVAEDALARDARLLLTRASDRGGLGDVELARIASAGKKIANGDYQTAIEALAILNADLDQSVKVRTVAAGENLRSIAAREDTYGNAALWPLIWRANREALPEPWAVQRDQKLVMPSFPSLDDVTAALRYAQEHPQDVERPKSR